MSKTARLEEKLDSLVSLMKTGVQHGTVTSSPQCTDGSSDAAFRTSASTENQLASNNSNGYVNDIQTSVTANVDLIIELSPTEAEEYLMNFRNYKLKFFPFIHLPPTVTAEQLHQDRPFLWLCIMTASCKSTSKQLRLGNKIRQVLAEKIVVQSEKNIDLLLGLLTFIGWYGICFSSHRKNSGY